MDISVLEFIMYIALASSINILFGVLIGLSIRVWDADGKRL